MRLAAPSSATAAMSTVMGLGPHPSEVERLRLCGALGQLKRCPWHATTTASGNNRLTVTRRGELNNIAASRDGHELLLIVNDYITNYMLKIVF